MQIKKLLIAFLICGLFVVVGCGICGDVFESSCQIVVPAGTNNNAAAFHI